mmetsp:Transcript_11817/g.47679  ORF Transcript_11817/g.47679 Transcript_11817/m.47679 type:complete len:203 (+) Transcript_11817:434-1042(+)
MQWCSCTADELDKDIRGLDVPVIHVVVMHVRQAASHLERDEFRLTRCKAVHDFLQGAATRNQVHEEVELIGYLERLENVHQIRVPAMLPKLQHGVSLKDVRAKPPNALLVRHGEALRVSHDDHLHGLESSAVLDFIDVTIRPRSEMTFHDSVRIRSALVWLLDDVATRQSPLKTPGGSHRFAVNEAPVISQGENGRRQRFSV